VTPSARRRILVVSLLAPLAAVPLLAFALMEFGPERSFLFAVYLLVFAITFLIAGVAVARRRPTASAGQVLSRAALWALLTVAGAVAALVVLSFVVVPRTP
jgi:hypothetical protein